MIDRKLADFINNWPDKHKLKMLFMRESEGIYLFGTKRTAIRLENDKITVRVGGGYLLIEEFLDQYTHIEHQKLQRKQEKSKENQRQRSNELKQIQRSDSMTPLKPVQSNFNSQVCNKRSSVSNLNKTMTSNM